MTVTIPADQFMDLGNKKRVAETIADAVKLLIEKKMFTPAFCLIAVGIDALSGGPDREDYISSLESNFPELCKQLGAAVFYSKYRNGMLHEYAPKKGFALAEAREIGDRFVDGVKKEGTETTLTGLNVERLANEFIAFTKRKA